MTIPASPDSFAGPADLDASTSAFLKALASETRQQLLLLFSSGGELTVGEVAERAGIGQSTASEQLSILRSARLVKASREGKLVRYRADRDGIADQLGELQDYLRNCCR